MPRLAVQDLALPRSPSCSSTRGIRSLGADCLWQCVKAGKNMVIVSIEGSVSFIPKEETTISKKPAKEETTGRLMKWHILHLNASLHFHVFVDVL